MSLKRNTGPSVDEEGNDVQQDHVLWSCDRRGRFHRQIAESFDDSTSQWCEEKTIFEYMLNNQSNPETVDEICRQTGVETEYVLHWLETMVVDGLVNRVVTSGVTRYVLTEKGKSWDYISPCVVRPKFFLSSHSESCDNDVNGNSMFEQWSESKQDSSASAEELEQHLEEGCWVLVTGCDSGEFIAGLAKKFPHTSFIALNNNRKSLLSIMKTCFHAEAYNVNVQEGDTESLPNSWIHCFDWVIIYDVNDDVTNLKNTLKNTRRILKKSGVMSLTFNPNKSLDGDVSETENVSNKEEEKGGSCKKGYPMEEIVRKTVSETMFHVIRSDELNSNEDRVHIMCVHNNEM